MFDLYSIQVVFFAAIFAEKSVAQFGYGGNAGNAGNDRWGDFPTCASSCSINWGFDCSSSSFQDCFCGNETKVASFNSCVDSSSCDDADKTSIYKIFAQLCATLELSITATPEATGVITANPSWTTNSAWTGSNGLWTGSNGPWGAEEVGGGPFGGGWGPWGSSGSWTAGPWTSWWNGTACPGSTWSGWTSGDWDTKGPWTSWSACSATTTATVTFTTTATNGAVITGTSFGIKVAEATATATTSSPSSINPSSTATSSANEYRGDLSWQFVFGSFVVVAVGLMAVL